jgi:uncharacterized membrane protein YheB (UPF0754 family)
MRYNCIKKEDIVNKSQLTDTVSILLVAAGYMSPEPYHTPMLMAGLFAFSGAVTNQLAIHMLFHRVPGFYGSGVIERNFETFKDSIRKMVMTQFFTTQKLNEFFVGEEQKIDLAPLVESADFDPAFDALKSSVMESKLGQMLQMFGGEEALEPLRGTFVRRLKSAVVGIVSTEAFNAQIQHHMLHSSLSSDLQEQIERIVTRRLDELTPAMVKELVFDLIHEHMGWLVVWGGVIGGLIGLVSSLAVH